MNSTMTSLSPTRPPISPVQTTLLIHVLLIGTAHFALVHYVCALIFKLCLCCSPCWPSYEEDGFCRLSATNLQATRHQPQLFTCALTVDGQVPTTAAVVQQQCASLLESFRELQSTVRRKALWIIILSSLGSSMVLAIGFAGETVSRGALIGVDVLWMSVLLLSVIYARRLYGSEKTFFSVANERDVEHEWGRWWSLTGASWLICRARAQQSSAHASEFISLRDSDDESSLDSF